VSPTFFSGFCYFFQLSSIHFPPSFRLPSIQFVIQRKVLRNSHCKLPRDANSSTSSTDGTICNTVDQTDDYYVIIIGIIFAANRQLTLNRGIKLSHNEVTRRENCVILLQYSTPPTKYPPIRVETRSTVNGSPSLVLSRLDFGNATLTGAPAYLLQRLQSVMNAAARLIFSSSRFDHISPLLSRLHWLKGPERISYNVAVLAYQCQHGLAPTYLSDELRRPADTEVRQRLRSALSVSLAVRRTRLSTVCDRAFPVAAARLWDSLPSHVSHLCFIPLHFSFSS